MTPQTQKLAVVVDFEVRQQKFQKRSLKWFDRVFDRRFKCMALYRTEVRMFNDIKLTEDVLVMCFVSNKSKLGEEFDLRIMIEGIARAHTAMGRII